MKNVITALALAAVLALVTGCTPGTATVPPVAVEQAEPAPEPAAVEISPESVLREYFAGTGSTPVEIDAQVEAGYAFCDLADAMGATEALLYAFGELPDEPRASLKAAEAVGAGVSAFCPAHAWAIEELGGAL